MLHGVAVVQPGIVDQQLLDGIDKEVDRRVAIEVGMDVDARLMKRPQLLEELLRGDPQDALIYTRVVPRPVHDRGPGLNGPINDELHPRKAQLVAAGGFLQIPGRRRRGAPIG
jgi:hypothetical protein